MPAPADGRNRRMRCAWRSRASHRQRCCGWTRGVAVRARLGAGAVQIPAQRARSGRPWTTGRRLPVSASGVRRPPFTGGRGSLLRLGTPGHQRTLDAPERLKHSRPAGAGRESYNPALTSSNIAWSTGSLPIGTWKMPALRISSGSADRPRSARSSSATRPNAFLFEWP